MPFVAPLRRDRQTPRSRSRSTTPANFSPVIPPDVLSPVPLSASFTDDTTSGQRPPLSSGNMNGPQRNISTSSSASGATSTSGASSTSSLEAVPIKPAAGTRIEGYGISTTPGGGLNWSSEVSSPPTGSAEEDWTGGTPVMNRSATNGDPSSGFIVLSRNPSNQSTSTQSSPYRQGLDRGRDDTLSPGAPAPTMTMRNTARANRAPMSSGLWTTSPSQSATNLLSPGDQLLRSRTPPSPSPIAYTADQEFPINAPDQAPHAHQPQPRRLSQVTTRQFLYETSPPPLPASSSQAPFPHSASSATISSAPFPRPMSAAQQLFLPAEMRSSQSGPDLASLQKDRERERRERARKTDLERQGDEADGEADDDPNGVGMNGSRIGARAKIRTRSAGAQTMVDNNTIAGPASQTIAEDSLSTGQGGPQPRQDTRKTVTLEDFTFGTTLGRGSYSVVVLASQNITKIPYAVKILDQQQLLQEKKTKYAKIERDALIRLGPRASIASNGAIAGAKQREGDRRGSTASQGSSRGPGKTRREMTEPGKRRTPSSATPSQSGVTLEMDSGIAVYQERRSTEMRRENFSDAGKAMSRDVGFGGDHRRPIMSMDTGGDPIMRTGRAIGRPESHMPEAWTNPTLSATSHTNVGSRRTLLLQTANLPALRSDESALAMSPDSVTSSMSFVGETCEQSQTRNARQVAKRRRSAHPGVVKLHFTFKDHASLYFVLDLAINGELLGLIRKHGSFDIESARMYAAQIIDTIDFMHERGVIHRDLKPENILLDDDMRIKITDFGSAKILDPDTMLPIDAPEDGKKRSFVGTAEYVSPEVLQNDPATTASDVWAFGCIIFQMIAGRPPFRGATEYLTFQKVLKAECEFPEGFDAHARNLVESIFRIEPSARPSVDTVKAHPFFGSVQSSLPNVIHSPDFTSIWNGTMPPILPGLVPPPLPPTTPVDLSRHGWNDFLGHSGTSGSEDTHGDRVEQDDGLDSAEEEEIMRRPSARLHQHHSEGASYAFGEDGASVVAVASPEERDYLDGDLEAPRRRWLTSKVSALHGAANGLTSPLGTAESRNGTDDDVSLVGAGGGGSARDSMWGGSWHESSGVRRPSESGSRGATTIKQIEEAGFAPSGQDAPDFRSTAWMDVLLPSERIVYSTPILYRSPASLFLPKRRTLVLTTLPRLICAKEDSSTPDSLSTPAASGKAGTGIKIKAECLFGRAALDLLHGCRSPSGHDGGGLVAKGLRDKEKAEHRQGERIRRTVAKVWEKGPRAFVVQTPEKDHTFLADREETRTKWMSEIARATGDGIGSTTITK